MQSKGKFFFPFSVQKKDYISTSFFFRPHCHEKKRPGSHTSTYDGLTLYILFKLRIRKNIRLKKEFKKFEVLSCLQ